MAVRQDASTGELVQDGSAPAPPKAPVSDLLQVRVWSPFRIYFEGEAKSVSGVDASGPFDILPKHGNFIALLTACELVVATKAGEVRIRISGGIMRVHRNQVTVFLEV